MRKRWNYLLLTTAIVLGCAHYPPMKGPVLPWRGEIPMVRVQIAQVRQALQAKGRDGLEIREGRWSRLVAVVEAEATVKIEVEGETVTVLGRGPHRSVVDLPLLLRPGSMRGWVEVEGKPYRGEVEVWANDGVLVAINRLEVEDYLRGVIPGELGRIREEEAAKAQAVAARTYALAQLNREREFDLHATISDQLYEGVAGEDEFIDGAIKETCGMVMLHQGQLIKAYYHSTCGGLTERIENVWERKEPQPYLVSVLDGRPAHCAWAPHYSWTEQWSRKELEEMFAESLPPLLHKRGEDVGRLVDLRVLKRTSSGRAECLEIETERGIFHIYQDDIRRALRRPVKGHPILRSTAFELHVHRDGRGEIDSVDARGYGYGHGVGMCQCGAIGMARKGYRWDQILEHYYPGVTIRRLY